MQLSATNARGLLPDIDQLCGTNSVTYPTNDKVRNLNQSFHEVSRLIREVEFGWQYDDTNKVDMPIATTNLINAQQDYELPDGAQSIERIEVLSDTGDYYKVIQMDWQDVDISLSEFEGTNSFPKYYDLVGNSVFLYPAPASADVTTADGLKVYFSRDINELSATSLDDEPGFAKPFHRILSLDASIIYEKEPTQLSKLIGMRKGLVESMKKFYAHRNVERPRVIRPMHKSRWRQYL